MISAKQKEIATLIAEGGTTKSIGAKIGLSPRTVERHIENIKLKFGAKNTPNLIAILFRKNLIK